MILLDPSILAADFTKLGEQISQITEGGCDYLHFDVMDGMFVPNISFGLPVLQSIKPSTNVPMDVHLMIEAPERYVERFIKAGADIVTVHQEASDSLDDIIDLIHSFGKKAGIAVKPHTDVSVLVPYFGKADMFLIMTVEPGFGGQEYMPMCTDKIKNLRNMLNENNLNTDIQVDGGITKDNVDVVLNAGANVIVMGSSVFKGDIVGNARYFTDHFASFDK